MKIWQLHFELDIFDNLIAKENFSTADSQSFDGRNKAEQWQPLELIRMEPNKNLPLSDAPGFRAHIPIFSKKTIEILTPLVLKDIEILPLIFNENDFFLINITTVLDCINYEKSKYIKFPTSGKIMMV